MRKDKNEPVMADSDDTDTGTWYLSTHSAQHQHSIR